MKISIITAVFNGEKTTGDCIKSIKNQKFTNTGNIIIDSGSTDGTLNVIEKYNDSIAKFISEPDKGIYDAMNKGIRLATGDIVGILNSDDIYADESVIENVVEYMTDKNTDTCYGDLMYVERKDVNKIIRYWKSEEFHRELYENSCTKIAPAILNLMGCGISKSLCYHIL